MSWKPSYSPGRSTRNAPIAGTIFFGRSTTSVVTRATNTRRRGPTNERAAGPQTADNNQRRVSAKKFEKGSLIFGITHRHFIVT